MKPDCSFKDFVQKLAVAWKHYGSLSLAAGINQHFALQTSQCGQLCGLEYDLELQLEDMINW